MVMMMCVPLLTSIYVSCKLPAEDGKLKDLVLLLQKQILQEEKKLSFQFP